MKVSKYDREDLKINPRYPEDEPQNTYSHKTRSIQLKQRNQLSLSLSLSLIKMIAKLKRELSNA